MGFVNYRSSRNAFLSAKNDMISKDLARLKTSFTEFKSINWLLDYWREHPEEVVKGYKTEGHDKELETLYDTEYEAGGTVFVTAEILEKLTPFQQFAFASNAYLSYKDLFNSTITDSSYNSAYCISISEENAPPRTAPCMIVIFLNLYPVNTPNGTSMIILQVIC